MSEGRGRRHPAVDGCAAVRVVVDCDKRVKFRGSSEYEGGWYYAKVTDKGAPCDDEFGLAKTHDRWETYAECVAAARANGHEVDNAGWRRKMLSWNFTSHSLDDYPGWEHEDVSRPDRPKPAYVRLAHTRGPSGSAVESTTLCQGWDDIAEADFYQRDHTSDGIPWCSEGEVYWSSWWFAKIAERDRFVAWVRSLGAIVEVQ